MKRENVKGQRNSEMNGHRMPRNQSQKEPPIQDQNLAISRPHRLPTTGYRLVPASVPFQEEAVPHFNQRTHYFVRVGEIFQKRYQVICKLGFGGYATVWLARDLVRHDYVVLKVYARARRSKNDEITMYERIRKSIPGSRSKGSRYIRMMLGHFTVGSTLFSKHTILIYQPTQKSLSEVLHQYSPNGFPEKIVKRIIRQILEALDFCHVHAKIVHNDVHPGNIMLGLENNKVLAQLEEAERARPSDRKHLGGDRYLYGSQSSSIPESGPALLADFGCSKLGPGPHGFCTMPAVYQPPEGVLSAPFSYSLDIWAIGLTAWELLSGFNLFRNCGDFDNYHIAYFVSTLGHPGPDFLIRHRLLNTDVWDAAGRWRCPIQPVQGILLEDMVQSLSLTGKIRNPRALLAFLRSCMTWSTQHRASARQLLRSVWLNEP